MEELELAWEKRREYTKWCKSDGWKATCGIMDVELAEAQAKWKVKFGRTWVDALKDKATALLSPKKRKRQGGPLSSAKKPRLEPN